MVAHVDFADVGAFDEGRRGRENGSAADRTTFELVAVDVVAFVSAVDSNEHLAEAAARGAAKASSQDTAQTVAEDVVKHCTPPWMVQKVMIDDVEYDIGKGMVSVATLMQMKLPVPLPGYSEISCRASSIEPIVSTPAPN